MIYDRDYVALAMEKAEALGYVAPLISVQTELAKSALYGQMRDNCLERADSVTPVTTIDKSTHQKSRKVDERQSSAL